MANYFLGTFILLVTLIIFGSTTQFSKDNAQEDKSGQSQLCHEKDAQLAALQDKLAQQQKQMELEHATEISLKRATRSTRQVRDQLETCQSEAHLKTAAIKEQAQLIAELETKDANAERRQAKLAEELRRCRAAKRNAITENSCMPFEDSRLHMVRVPGARPFQVACDSRIAGAGWMVVQRRLNGAVDFYRNWREYRAGFGDLRREFFIGLEKLHQLTTLHRHELHIQMQDVNNVTSYAHYDEFKVGGRSTEYKLLSLGEYEGNAGDAMRIDERMKFTTYDRDNDRMLDRNCAQFAHSAWWYKSCSWSNLNGGYFNQKGEETIWWQVSFKPATFTRLKTVIMLIRPIMQL